MTTEYRHLEEAGDLDLVNLVQFLRKFANEEMLHESDIIKLKILLILLKKYILFIQLCEAEQLNQAAEQ